jgi:hypothetical protein
MSEDNSFKYIDEEKELGVDETQNTPEENVEEAQATEETTNEEDPSSLKVGEHEFESVDELINFASERDKSYQNAQQLIGRQGTELGDLRQSVDKLSENLQSPQDETPDVQFDPYDSDSVKAYLDQEREKIVADVMGQVDKKERERKETEARSMEVQQFIKANPKLNDNDLSAIAKYGDERGVLRFEDAYKLKRYEEMAKEFEDIKSQKEATKKEEASNAPQTLAGIGGSNKGDIDYDNLSPQEWNKLPSDVREKALMEASPGT